MTTEIRRPITTLMGREMKLFSEITAAVQLQEPGFGAIENIMKSIGQVVDFRSASVFSAAKSNGQLTEIATIGRRVDLIDFVAFDLGNGISAWVAKQKRPILLNNVRKTKGGTHTRSFLAVPILCGKEVKGVINLAHDEAEAFSKEDIEIVKAFANIIGLIIERLESAKVIEHLQNQISALSAELENGRSALKSLETAKGDNEGASLLGQKLNNPLAIIAGNAQFLLMTMKNSDGSVIKRLKAIDNEATSLISLAEQFCSLQKNENGKISLVMKKEALHAGKIR